MKSAQAGIVPIIVVAIAVVILIGAGGAAYYFMGQKPANLLVSSSQSNETHDWQEYINPKYDYKIKYPPDWFFHKTGYNPPPPTSIELSNVDEALGEVGNEIRLEVTSLPGPGESLESNAEIKSLVGDGFSKQEIIISGEKAIRLEKKNDEGGVETLIYVYHQGNVYRFVWNLWNSEINRLYQGLLEKIISTFTFTN